MAKINFFYTKVDFNFKIDFHQHGDIEFILFLLPCNLKADMGTGMSMVRYTKIFIYQTRGSR
jgi:hypothetical protein